MWHPPQALNRSCCVAEVTGGITCECTLVENMDDWLDAGDDESALAERHSARMEREFGDAGYLEGLEVAKETRMQEGFNLVRHAFTCQIAFAD